jgi:hypothetical protein
MQWGLLFSERQPSHRLEMQSEKGVQPELHGQSARWGLQLDFGAQ